MKKKLLLVVLLLTFILFSQIFILDIKAEEQDEIKNLDVVLILDNSGSMSMSSFYNGSYSENSKWDDAIDAASSKFIEQLRDDDRCSIFCFQTNSESNMGWGDHQPRKLKDFIQTDADGKNELINSFDCLSPGGSTPLFDTVGYAMDYIVDNKREESIGAIVALTDGIDNVCYQFYPSHEYRVEEEIDASDVSYTGDSWGPSSTRYGLLEFSDSIFIIGLGLNTSYYDNYRKQLENISYTSKGGTFQSVDDSSKLGSKFLTIISEVKSDKESEKELNKNPETQKNSDEEKKEEKLELSDEELLLPILIFTIIIVSLLIFVGFSLTRKK